MSERVKTLSGYDAECLFWLAARDLIVFSTYDPIMETHNNYWHAAVCCNDTFYYATADAEDLAPGEELRLRAIYERHGWPGVVAWCAVKRGEEPLPQLRTPEYLSARMELDHGSVD